MPKINHQAATNIRFGKAATRRAGAARIADIRKKQADLFLMIGRALSFSSAGEYRYEPLAQLAEMPRTTVMNYVRPNDGQGGQVSIMSAGRLEILETNLKNTQLDISHALALLEGHRKNVEEATRLAQGEIVPEEIDKKQKMMQSARVKRYRERIVGKLQAGTLQEELSSPNYQYRKTTKEGETAHMDSEPFVLKSGDIEIYDWGFLTHVINIKNEANKEKIVRDFAEKLMSAGNLRGFSFDIKQFSNKRYGCILVRPNEARVMTSTDYKINQRAIYIDKGKKIPVTIHSYHPTSAHFIFITMPGENNKHPRGVLVNDLIPANEAPKKSTPQYGEEIAAANP